MGKIDSISSVTSVSKSTINMVLIFVVLPFLVHAWACYEVGGNFLLYLGLCFPPIGVYHGYQIIFTFVNGLFI